MAAGFLFQSVCYPSLVEATSAHWSSNPVSITPGSTSYLTDVVWSGSAWVVKQFSLSPAGVLTLNSSTNAPTLAFESCDTKTQFDDGMLLGWGVAAAMIAAWAIKVMGFGVNR